MLLFKKRFHEGLVKGDVTVTYRRWKKPHVRPGGRYRCHPIGVLEVDEVKEVAASSIQPADATKAGFPTKAALLAYLEELGPVEDDTKLYRVQLHYGGDGDRVELALSDQLTEADVEAIAAKLAKLDAKQPWTEETFDLIERRPRVAASKLAAELGRETEPFKIDVRKLKKLGLTQAFEVGYELSPRGKAYRAARKKAGSKPGRRKK